MLMFFFLYCKVQGKFNYKKYKNGGRNLRTLSEDTSQCSQFSFMMSPSSDSSGK